MKLIYIPWLFGEDAFYNDAYNLLDLLVGASGNKSLRVFRVLRPLKTVNKFKGLKTLLNSLVASIPMLADSLTFVFVLFTAFAIMGNNLFSGYLKYNCIKK
jgi:hypothetical protein